jgi:hypothetical protein
MTKHIEMRYHYVRDIVQKNILSIQYVPTTEQMANILTKSLSLTKLCTFKTSLVLLRMSLLLRGSVEFNAAARAILLEDGIRP